jgi:hypothetical protein
LSSEHLICPGCGSHHGPDQQFCAQCSGALGMDEAPQLGRAAQERQDHLRKIDPRFTEGKLVKVAGGRHLADSEMIQGLLLEYGIPSMTKRAGGYDVPDFLASGPRDILVPSSAEEAARNVLGDMATGDLSAAAPNPKKVFAGLIALLAVGAVVVFVADRLS